MSLWSDIKQRRITQIVVGYIAAGWIVLSVFDQFADRGVVPDVVYRVALVVYLFGIPAALILGWHHGEKGRQQTTPGELIQVGLIAVACLATSVWIVRGWVQEQARAELLTLESSLDLRSVAVRYFEADESELEAVAAGLTESLIQRLAEVRDLDVVSARGTAQFRGSDLPSDSIAKLLGAGTLIEGRIAAAGDELRVDVALLDGESGTELERFSLRRPADDPVAVSQELPVEVARRFREVLGQEIDLRQARRGTTSTPAWLLVQRARKAVQDAEAAAGHGDAGTAMELYRSADAQLREAVELDPEWSEPRIERGWVAYAVHPFAHDPEELGGALRGAIARADEALELEPTNAAALELRGTARYRLWLARLEPSPRSADALFESARGDLEQAIRLDEGRARAHNALSHLYLQTGQSSQAILAARKAYEEDAYLQAVDQVLQRLFTVSYDMEEYAQARDWCQEGHRRFPRDFRFLRCQIMNMTMEAAEPDVDEAWAILDEMTPLVPDPIRVQTAALSRVAVGAVIARAGLPDSADAVIAAARAEGDPVDPDDEILVFEAAMRSVMGQRERAMELLETYALRHPGHFGADRGLHWWYRTVRDDPRFESIRRVNR